MLEWWRERDCKQGLPNLAQLARQFLGFPASFSHAGRMPDILTCAMNDGKLEHSLFASHSTE